jgi:hypothetical protein
MTDPTLALGAAAYVAAGVAVAAIALRVAYAHGHPRLIDARPLVPLALGWPILVGLVLACLPFALIGRAAAALAGPPPPPLERSTVDPFGSESNRHAAGAEGRR